TGMSMDSLRAWDTMVRQERVTRFKQAFVQRQLWATLAARVTPEHIDRLIDKLDAASFAERRRAFSELESILPLAVDALHRAAAAQPPLEKLRRIEALLDQAKGLPTAEDARSLAEILPHTVCRLVLADLDAFDRGKPAPAPSMHMVLQALEE